LKSSAKAIVYDKKVVIFPYQPLEELINEKWQKNNYSVAQITRKNPQILLK
jgi:hypothetical protein